MHRVVLSLLLAVMACQMATPAWALYKVVGPDGRITYTDRAPSDKPAQSLKANGATASTEGLPYELQRVVARYPVSLFTGPKCAACDAARQMLKERGVPFVEKTVSTSDDARAYLKQEGTDQLPSARIGQKQLLGYNQAEWTSYVDAAGYPAKSALPLNYRQPEATPMAPIAPASSKAASAPATKTVPGADTNNNAPAGSAPPGFRF
ncbi:MAG TPA: glutaredoxin family protein [Aquabacterium sp.]|uniref:glutaredoxin family protein n=1 Tax=Aquabacterium sp. TaxID=1872578 RepID=UPI002E2F8455|nr:glutaredoxin family protein [Aquabacterium sp.]HEX5358189.1 glutaredoxin family protein [Aquabacterium sp.]